MGNCFGSLDDVHQEEPPHDDDHHQQQKYVTAQVQKLRGQAETYHQKVVDCAKQSQQAYQKGDKKKAKELSDQKKSWQVKQDDANKKAATAILTPQKWQSTGEIDLHGLHLDEAMEATRNFLKYWSKKAKDTVLIITGAGHHSAHNKAVIRPKVEELLRKERLQYESVHGNGAFKVHIKPSQ